MDAPQRDLASVEVWDRSLERSRRRRVLAAQGRKEVARRKQASVAASAALVASPSAAAFAAAGSGGGSGSHVSDASSANRAIAPAAPAHYLRLGSQGPDVVRVQSALAQAPDGIFGSRTDAAVRIFQARNGLVVDGIVGPKTWGVLFGPHGASYDPATPKYQFQIQRASQVEEAQVRPALAGRGPVAKIVLRSTPGAGAPAAGGQSHRSHASLPAPHAPATEPAVDHSPSATPHTVSNPEPSTPVRTSCGSSRIVAPVKGYTVTGDFGESRPGHLHSGLDLAVPMGTPIVAAACGVVTTVESQSGYGNIVCIRHSSTLTTCYAHMSRFASHVGQHVHQGQVIGYVGCTGNCTGPHVHFETRANGTPVDPPPYLSGAKRARSAHAAPARSGSGSGSNGARAASSASANGSGPGTATADGSTSKGGSTAKSASSSSASYGSGGTAAPEPTASSQAAAPSPEPPPAPAGAAPGPPPAAPRRRRRRRPPAPPRSRPPRPPRAPPPPPPEPLQQAPAPAPAPAPA